MGRYCNALLHYTGRHRLPEDVEKGLDLTYHPNVESMVRVCDVVTINAPLHPETEHLFNDALIGKMKRGALTNHWLRRCHRFHSPEIAAGFRGS